MDEILAVSLADDTLAWQLDDDVWRRVARHDTLETHMELQQQALQRALFDLR